MTHKEKLQNRKVELLKELQSVEDQLENYNKIFHIKADKPFREWALSEMQELMEINMDALEWFTDGDGADHKGNSIRDYNATHTVKVRIEEP